MKLLRVLSIFLLTWAGQAGVAHAKQDDGILEHLSGPGPFRRNGWLNYRIACLSKAEPAKPEFTAVGQFIVDDDKKDPKGYWSFMRPWNRGAGLEFPHFPVEEDSKDDEKRRAYVQCANDERVLGYVSVSYAGYRSLENNLFPGHETDDVNEVKARSASVRVAARVMRDMLDVGLGFDVFWFHGDQFKSFHKYAIEPVRVSVAPFVPFASSRRGRARARAVHFTVAPTIFFGTFHEKDFCTDGKCTATARPFRSEAEIIFATTVDVDLVTLLWR